VEPIGAEAWAFFIAVPLRASALSVYQIVDLGARKAKSRRQRFAGPGVSWTGESLNVATCPWGQGYKGRRGELWVTISAVTNRGRVLYRVRLNRVAVPAETLFGESTARRKIDPHNAESS